MALNRVTWLCLTDNKAAVKTLHKFNYKEEGLLREYGFFEGRFYDVKIFSILKRDYMKDLNFFSN